MAYYDMNRYALGSGRRLSSRQHASPTMSWSRRATNGTSYHNSPSGYQQTYGNSPYIQSPENANYQDGATPQMVSPYPEADVMNMQDPAPFTENPRMNGILDSFPQINVSYHTFPRNTGYSPPWNGLHAEANYGAMAVDTSDELFDSMIDQNMLLDIPNNTRGRGTGTRGSVSTVGTPFTASSDGRSDVNQEHIETRRGGRQPGSRLPEDGVQNVRQVRESGACIRCRILRMKCSGVTPCTTCKGLQSGRKWPRCLRSFSHMAQLLKPDILAERLQFHNMAAWVSQHTYCAPEQELLELPLRFGFGEIFNGFSAIEYDPTTVEAQLSHAVSHSAQPRIRPGIPVCPIYESKDAQKMVWHWMKKTLTSRRSMDDWLEKCFPGDRVEWIRELLLSTWVYSIKCWDESRLVQIEESELDNNLLEAWMAALLVGMLSLPVTIPKRVVRNIIPQLRFRNYNDAFANSSRVLTKAVKALLFDMYQEFVHRLTSALQDFGSKPEEVSERRLGHIYCIAILVIVLNCQLQTSLMDNGQLSRGQAGVDPNLWEVTYEHMRGTECAFKNTIMFVTHNNNRWLKKNEILDKKLLDLRQDIQEIEHTYHDAIDGHRNVDLERLMRSDVPFHESNMQRVFAFFFDLVFKEKSKQAE